MNGNIELFLANLTEFALFFVVAAILMVVFVIIYTAVTKHHEMALIKQNSVAAALAFSGSLIGFALPLASTLIHSLTLLELVLWGLVAMVVQIFVYFLLRLPMPGISDRITANETAAGLWLGACSLVAGILNAASMTP